MGFWLFVTVLVASVFGVIGFVWLRFPNIRGMVRERIFTGLISCLVIMIGLYIVMSGVFYQPKNVYEQFAITIIATLALSALAAAIGIVMYKKTMTK